MKKLIIAAFALAGFSVAGFAQTATPPKKSETVKTQPVKNKSDAKAKAINVSPGKTTATTQSAHTNPNEKHAEVKQQNSKPAATLPAVPAAPVPSTTGKDGKPGTHHKSNNSQAAHAATGHLKKDGTPEKDVKEHKKQG